MTGFCKQAGNVSITRHFHHFNHEALKTRFIICKNLLLQCPGWFWGRRGVGVKVNQLGYVVPHVYMDRFQEIVFCILAGSICILWNISIYCC